MPLAQARPRGLYRRKFVLVYLVLAALLAGAVAGLVVLLYQPDDAPEIAWSAWEPAAEAESRPQEIANFVASSYRLDSGSQLVRVQAAPLRVQDAPVGAIVVRRPAGAAGASEDDVTVYSDVDQTVAYFLCGFGEECSIAEGDPTPERLRLVRREVLELALYTFRYVDDARFVVAYLPPPSGSTPTAAVFLRKDDLELQLERPLAATLSSQVPLPNGIAATEAQIIDRLTLPGVFRFSFQQVQDGTAALVLDNVQVEGE